MIKNFQSGIQYTFVTEFVKDCGTSLKFFMSFADLI